MIRVISKENYKKTLKTLEDEIENKKKIFQGSPLTLDKELLKIENCIAFVKLVYINNRELKNQKSLFWS